MLKGNFFKNVFQKIDQLVTGRGVFTPELYDELEEAMIASDLNVNTALRLIADLRKAVPEEGLKTAEDVKDKLRDLLIQTLIEGEQGYFSPMKMAPVAQLFTLWLVSTVSARPPVSPSLLIASRCRARK
jgi:fused signal recognition particle receptor